VLSNFYHDLISGIQPKIYGHNTTRDFVYIDDVIDAILLAIDHPTNCRVNISSNIQIKLIDALKMISNNLGIDLQPEIVPPKLGDVRQIQMKNSLAKQILDWNPKVDFAMGISESCRV
jgi:UDP-glucose 4-epimerase